MITSMPAKPSIPIIKVQRPRTSPSPHLTARKHASATAGGLGGGGGGGGGEAKVGQYGHQGQHGGLGDHDEVELLEYEWPDLPPLSTIKDAITRNRVSRGISYLLPVDKGRNSINNKFRTDLRAMFQEPYASDDLQYDDNRVTLSSKVHFLSNTGDTKWTRQHLSSIPISLNSDSEKMRKLYAHSAPSGCVSNRRMGSDPQKLRTRSNLYLPLKASVPPELVKLRKEVEEIIKSVKEDDEFDAEKLQSENAGRLGDTLNSTDMHILHQSAPGPQDQHLHHNHHQQQHPHHHHPFAHQPSHHLPATLDPMSKARPGGAHNGGRNGSVIASLGTGTLANKLQTIQVSAERYNSYDELKSSKPPKPQIPDSIKSQFLNDEQNQEIWDWLHYGEEMNDFDFFLSVCG